MTPSDDDLMRMFCEGDEPAFDALYDRHADAVHGFLRRMLRDDAAADDAFQATFMSFVRGRGRYEAGTHVRAWLFAIAANAGRDALRRRASRPDSARASAARDAPEAFATATDPGLARDLGVAFESLPAAEREAIILHKLHGFSFEEIASSLSISVAAAKVRAHRGYQKLRRILGEPEPERDA